MTSKMSRLIWNTLSLCCVFLFIQSYDCLPATTSVPETTYIVSYVNQRKAATKRPFSSGGHNEYEEFDFENFSSNLTSSNPEMRGALQQFFGRFVENVETNLDKVEKNLSPMAKENEEPIENNEIFSVPESDDPETQQANTLDINSFGENEQHESRLNDSMWQRTKQSIPVLESVRHLVNSVRNGALNDTSRHSLLAGDMDTMKPHNGSDSSMAIETEEEREMINESNDLKFLEVLGSLGSRLWGFLSSFKQVFAASSGSASAALSAQSSAGSS